MDNLEQGTKLSVLIRGYITKNDERVYSNFSNMFSVATTPGDVTGLGVTRYNATTINLIWNRVSEDSSYTIMRCKEGTAEYETVATIDNCTYSDQGLKVATGYTYKVFAVMSNTTLTTKNEAGTETKSDIRSANDTLLITSTSPNPAYISQYKGGDCRVRVRWNRLSAGDGYILYMKNDAGQYIPLSKIEGITTNEYIQQGLMPGVTYHFMIIPYRMYNGLMYQAEMSNEVDIKPLGTITTSTKAKIYATKKKLKNSKVYKKYSDFSKAVKLSKTNAIPGLSMTNILGFASKKMIVQGICNARGYMLITAYDYKKEENSVVYVLDGSTGKYVCTLVLPDSYHVGGIAYDGRNIWVSTGSKVSCFTIYDLQAAVATMADSVQIGYKTTCPVKTQASFITYYKKKLWIGEHKETTSAKMYSYKINNKKTDSPTLTSVNRMVIPSRTQGVYFFKGGTMLVSRSNQVGEGKSKYYISEIAKYKPNWKTGKTFIKKNSCKGKITMPPMMEGITYKSGYLYVTFESANISNCTYKLDRICAMKYSKIKWKK